MKGEVTLKKRLFSFMATILLLIVIYSSSLINSELSTAQSDIVVSLITDNSSIVIYMFIRKFIGHFCPFLLLGFMLSVLKSTIINKQKWLSVIYMTLGLFLATSSEVMQLFIPGRVFSLKDILLNLTGFITGSVIYMTLLKGKGSL